MRVLTKFYHCEAVFVMTAIWCWKLHIAIINSGKAAAIMVPSDVTAVEGNPKKTTKTKIE